MTLKVPGKGIMKTVRRKKVDDEMLGNAWENGNGILRTDVAARCQENYSLPRKHRYRTCATLVTLAVRRPDVDTLPPSIDYESIDEGGEDYFRRLDHHDGTFFSFKKLTALLDC